MKVSSLLNRYLWLIGLPFALVPMAFFLGSTHIYPKPYYVIQVVCEAVLVGWLLALAMAADRAGRQTRVKMILYLTPALALMTVADVWVLATRYDTSGPGGRYCATHVFWEARYVHNNAAGFWERELDQWSDSDSQRSSVIAAVGDSFTWGQGIRGRQYRFSDVLEHSLRNEAGWDVRVINFGRAGADTRSEIEIIQNDAASVRPDIVMLFYVMNDIAPKKVRPVLTPKVWLPQFLRVSPSLNLLYWRTLGVVSNSRVGEVYFANLLAAYLDQLAFDAHAQDIARAVAAIRSLNARPVVVILPSPFFWQSAAGPHREAIIAKVTGAVRQTGADVIELQEIEKDMTAAGFALSVMDAHPNRAAHAVIAQRLHAWLLAHPEYVPSVTAP